MEIDIVIPMVFPADPYWQDDYIRSGAGGGIPTSSVRFRSWGTEELLIRCIRKYMPWIRKTHILLARESQAQRWMADSSVVYHRDFMPSSLLPCFNICTIEMFLHRIPDLAEHFIYSNDDFFPLSPLQPEDFFRNGLPCQHHVEIPYSEKPNLYERFVMNGLNMIAGDFGKRFSNTWLRRGHTMAPMLRSIVIDVCERHADRIGSSFTVNRNERNFNQYIFSYYQHFAGLYVDYEPRNKYMQPDMPIPDLIAAIKDPDVGILCINDYEKIADWEKRAAFARREIAAKLKAGVENMNLTEGK